MIDDFSATFHGIPAGLLRSGIAGVERITGGHIHASWKVVDGEGRLLVVQSINTSVFSDVGALAENLVAVTDALRAEHLPYAEPVAVGPDLATIYMSEGQFWRAASWVHGRRPNSDDLAEVRSAAHAYGRFDAAVAGLGDIHEVITDFHDPDLRFGRLLNSIAADPHGRAGLTAGVVDRIGGLMTNLAPALNARRELPTRVVHNDAKLDNAIFTDTGDVVVIDLDTVMSGRIVDDIGEMIRSVVRSDEDQVSTQEIPVAIVAALVSGFTEGFGGLTPSEVQVVPWAGAILTVENAMRFLTDFIEGDIYFAVDDPEHNLRRAIAQIDLAERLVGAHDLMADALAKSIRG